MKTFLTVMVYDIRSSRRRTQLHRLLSQYGAAIQKSTFEARLTSAERRRILERAEGWIDAETDRFTLYVVGKPEERHIETLGVPRPVLKDEGWYVV